MTVPSFDCLARQQAPELDQIALALAAEFRAVDSMGCLAELDRLGAELAHVLQGSAQADLEACRRLLAEQERFKGNRDEYDDPANSMLDLVLERRTGLPILLSVVYVEVARRAGLELAGVGLPGHYVVGYFGESEPVLLDPFSGGRVITDEVRREAVRPWGVHETALRMLNNLVRSFAVRGDIGRAIRAAELRLALPLEEQGRVALHGELRALRARLN